MFRSGTAAVDVIDWFAPWFMPIEVTAPFVQATVTEPFASSGVEWFVTTGS
jgi:hypothetical protein